MLSKNLWFIRAALPPSLGGAVLYNKGKDAELKRAIQQAQIMEKRGETVNMRSLFGEARDEGRAEGRQDIRNILIAGGMKPKELQERLIAGGMAPVEAANFAGLPVT